MSKKQRLASAKSPHIQALLEGTYCFLTEAEAKDKLNYSPQHYFRDIITAESAALMSAIVDNICLVLVLMGAHLCSILLSLGEYLGRKRVL